MLEKTHTHLSLRKAAARSPGLSATQADALYERLTQHNVDRIYDHRVQKLTSHLHQSPLQKKAADSHV